MKISEYIRVFIWVLEATDDTDIGFKSNGSIHEPKFTKKKGFISIDGIKFFSEAKMEEEDDSVFVEYEDGTTKYLAMTLEEFCAEFFDDYPDKTLPSINPKPN